MHRGYRSIITAAGMGAQIVDIRQTQWAMRHGFTEWNPLYVTDKPSAMHLALGGVAGTSLTLALHEVVERLPDRGPESEWWRDVVMTIPFIIEAHAVWHNIDVLEPHWQEW